MKKFILVGALAGSAMLMAGCTTSNVGEVHSLQSRVGTLQSELASVQRYVSTLRHDLIEDQTSLFLTWRMAEQPGASRLAVANRLETELRQK